MEGTDVLSGVVDASVTTGSETVEVWVDGYQYPYKYVFCLMLLVRCCHLDFRCLGTACVTYSQRMRAPEKPQTNDMTKMSKRLALQISLKRFPYGSQGGSLSSSLCPHIHTHTHNVTNTHTILHTHTHTHTYGRTTATKD